jgi:hypothetical protein
LLPNLSFEAKGSLEKPLALTLQRQLRSGETLSFSEQHCDEKWPANLVNQSL